MLINQISTFEKVSLERFILDMVKPVENTYHITGEKAFNFIREMYERIEIPRRSTIESAGYDFIAYDHIILPKNKGVVIPTGIRCKIKPGYSLDLYPRSGQGFKNKIRIANTVGIIDSDYYYSDNEGHIIVKLVYEGFEDSDNDDIMILSGTAFAQRIFHEVFAATNDNENDKMVNRNGGFGSTSK